MDQNKGPKEVVVRKKCNLTEKQQQDLLQAAVFYFVQKNEFCGCLIQEFHIGFHPQCPTAAIAYNEKKDRFEILLGLDYFYSATPDERTAILTHEMMHFTNKHLFRFDYANSNMQEKMLRNIAQDMSINQYIQNMPKHTVKLADWKQKDGTPFPKYRPSEEYYKLINQDQENDRSNDGKDDKGRKERKRGDIGHGDPSDKGTVPEMLDKYTPFDVHGWEELDMDSLSEDDRRKMLEAAKKALQRTIEKSTTGRSCLPDSVKDLLEEIKVQIAKLDYKRILKEAIKKTMCAFDRDRTWHRPNKRYGVYAPGTTLGKQPNLEILADTSGSISHVELNSFMQVMDGFLSVGSKQCTISFWHTDMYHTRKYKRNIQLAKSELQSGGTDINCVFQRLVKSRPDLAIVLTDGYYGTSLIKPSCQIIWLISKGGTMDHPHKAYGKTLSLEGIING